jgi:hypothetical protein
MHAGIWPYACITFSRREIVSMMYHWTVKKDWHAHNSPVCGLLLDPSSVWIFKSSSNYLTMIGTDNFTRGWNARRRLAGVSSPISLVGV